MSDIATLARTSREQVQARASAPEQARESAPSPYVDATDPVAIPGTAKVALIVRDTRSDALYLCARNVSGNGRASRLHMDAIAALGFVHVSDVETLAEVGFVPAPTKTAKKASGK